MVSQNQELEGVQAPLIEEGATDEFAPPPDNPIIAEVDRLNNVPEININEVPAPEPVVPAPEPVAPAPEPVAETPPEVPPIPGPQQPSPEQIQQMQAQAAAKGTEGASMWDVLLGRPKVPGTAPEDWLKNLSPSELNEWAVKGGFRPSELAEVTGDWSAAYKPPFLSAGEAPFTVGGIEKEIANVGTNISTQMMNKATTIPELQKFAELGYGQANKLPIDLSYWMKPELTEGTPAYDIAMAKAGNTGLGGMFPDLPFKFLPTATPLGGGVYASREERIQAWERIKQEERMKLAWLYGVDPSEITSQMGNPLYDVDAPDLDWKYAPTANVNRGGIMDLDAGGDVSGPGTGTSDSINAKLSDGEFVMTAKAVENFGGGSRQAGANKMYQLMNQLDPQSETPQEGMA